MTGFSAPMAVDALGPSGAYRTRDRAVLSDVGGTPAVELSSVPRVFVIRALSALRKADPLPPDERVAALVKGAGVFATGAAGGLDPAAYHTAVSRLSGLPISVVRAAAENVARYVAGAFSSAYGARPGTAVDDWRDPLTGYGRTVWTRRGEVLAVHAAGNHPAVHIEWPEALALGYRVAVRPSGAEPLTAYRLVSALRSAGFGDDHVVLLPTDHTIAGTILDGADFGMVYGGDEVVRRYAGHSTMLPRGPGRSKILVTADTDWQEHLDTIVAAVSGQAGTTCVNTTAVFIEGDPAPLAEALAEHLAALPSLPPQDDRAVLPVQPLEAARRIERHLLTTAVGTTPWLGGDGIADDLGDGSAVLRPAVHQLSGPYTPQAACELPFPCVWVAPWTREVGLAPLRDSLVLTALTRDERLLDTLLADPTIGSLFVGDHPTWRLEPGLPHDDHLPSFLMRSKAVFRD